MGQQSAAALANPAIARRIVVNERHGNYSLALASDSGAAVQLSWDSLSHDARDAFAKFEAEVLSLGTSAMAKDPNSP